MFALAKIQDRFGFFSPRAHQINDVLRGESFKRCLRAAVLKCSTGTSEAKTGEHLEHFNASHTYFIVILSQGHLLTGSTLNPLVQMESPRLLRVKRRLRHWLHLFKGQLSFFHQLID